MFEFFYNVTHKIHKSYLPYLCFLCRRDYLKEKGTNTYNTTRPALPIFYFVIDDFKILPLCRNVQLALVEYNGDGSCLLSINVL